MKKGAISVTILLFLSAVLVYPQSYRGQGRMTGVVTDLDGKPLAGVKVKLYSQKGGAGFEEVTDAKGEWKANYVRGGGWNIDFEMAGYMPKKISTTIMENFQNPPISTKLQKIEGPVISDELKAGLDAGNKLFVEKKFEEAASTYEKLLAINPDVYIINKNIGNCYFELQKYDRAEECYQKILEKEPTNPEIITLIGNCYANRGENEKAMEWYNKVDFEKISDQMVLFNIGSSFYSQSKYQDALKYYKRAIEIQKDFLDAIYQLGLTYLAMGNNAEAIATFESYLKYGENSEKANQVRQFLEFLKKK